jgi:hypothetical protein
VKDRYRLVRWKKTYYAHDCATGKRISLQTSERDEARRMVAAKNQAASQPQLNTPWRGFTFPRSIRK